MSSLISSIAKLLTVKMRDMISKASYSDRISNISVFLNGIKPQNIKEEAYISKQESILLEKLKKSIDKCAVAKTSDTDDECSQLDKTIAKYCATKKNPLECREELYFHNQSLDEMQILKNDKPKSKND